MMVNFIIKHRYRFTIAFVLIGILCYMFPYTGDDWAWGSTIGLDRWNTRFVDYGGRYLGYAIVLVLTRNRLLRAIVMSISYLLIAACMESIVHKTWSFYLTMLLMAIPPRGILCQAVVWTSGFSNYVTSTVIMMVTISYIYKLFNKRNEKILCSKHRIFPSLVFFFLGMGGTLIVEHVTVYMVLLSVAVNIYFIIINKRLQLSLLALLFGSITGTIIMFSNNVYHKVSINQDDYRSVFRGGLLTRLKENYLDVILYEGVLCNKYLNLFIFIACLLVLKMIWRSTKKIGFWWLLLVIALLLYTWWVGHRLDCLFQLLFPLLSIITLFAPLFVVSPIGSRCFFPTYVLLILYFQLMISIVADKEIIMAPRAFHKYETAFLLSLCLIGYLRLIYIFYPVYTSDLLRLEHIKEQIRNGKQVIEVCHLQNEEYLWTSMPRAGTIWEERYKMFCGLPETIDFVDLP